MACEEPFEYAVYKDPTISISFIHQDSINTLQSTIGILSSSINTTDSLIEKLDSSIKVLTDTILAIENAVDTGNFDFFDQLQTLKTLFKNDSTNREVNSILLIEYQNLNDSIVAIVNYLKRGFTKLDYMKSLFSDVRLTYADSSDNYDLPLNISDTLSGFIISINDKAYELIITHSNEEVITSSLIAKIIFKDFSVLTHEFDSVYIECKTNCDLDEVAVYCYY